jgi:hypothetical protein
LLACFQAITQGRTISIQQSLKWSQGREIYSLILVMAIDWSLVENDIKQNFYGPLVSAGLDLVPGKWGNVQMPFSFVHINLVCPPYK